jgi:hypothetical protein
MNKRVQLACETTVRSIKVSKILPLRKISKGTKTTVKYRQISASMREIGIIEPIVVYPQDDKSQQYMLLDGHMRLEILKENGAETVECIIAIDDEAYTYNHKVNRVTVIQEHFMIMKAIKNGVSEQDIASVLDVDVARICKKRDLLIGICTEAVNLLKGKRANSGTFSQLRKVKPMRQIEMAELMSASYNFSVSYAKCLVAATPADQLIDHDGHKNMDGLSITDMARMEREMESLSKDFKQIEETHGKNVLNLVIVVGYLKKLMDNVKVVRYVAQNYPEILTEFQKIIESRSLEDAVEA